MPAGLSLLSGRQALGSHSGFLWIHGVPQAGAGSGCQRSAGKGPHPPDRRGGEPSLTQSLLISPGQKAGQVVPLVLTLEHPTVLLRAGWPRPSESEL